MVTFDICKGNPGAMTFLMNAYDFDMFLAETAFQKMQNMGITGDKLYMIWNDCCGRNTELALKMIENESEESIIHYLNYKNGRGIPYNKEV